MVQTRVTVAVSALLGFGGLVFLTGLVHAAPRLDRNVSALSAQSPLAPQAARDVCNSAGLCTWVPDERFERNSVYGREEARKKGYSTRYGAHYGRKYRKRGKYGNEGFRGEKPQMQDQYYPLPSYDQPVRR